MTPALRITTTRKDGEPEETHLELTMPNGDRLVVDLAAGDWSLALARPGLAVPVTLRTPAPAPQTPRAS